MRTTILLLITGLALFAADKKTYLDRAEQLEAKAAKHEANADELAKNKNYNPMRYKWPAMVQAPIDRERHQAMQARRAAREARELAAKLPAEAGNKAAGE
jgi:hypothetical protein